MYICTACNSQIHNLFHECGKPHRKMKTEVIAGQERRIVATFNSNE